MAVFEKKTNEKICIDDTKLVNFSFTNIIETSKHIEYVIESYRVPDWYETWTVTRRYSDFTKLHMSLMTPTIKLPPFPPKKMFGNRDKEFIIERKRKLEYYLIQIILMPYVSTSLQVKQFLDPENYVGNYLEEARQNLLVALRSGGSHEITQAISSMGTRIRKYNFMGYPLSDPKSNHLLWWAKYGPDRTAPLRDIHAALTALLQCQHFYIVSAIACVATESGVCVIRPWFSQGSLRDYIYGVKPQYSSVEKYTNNKRREIPFKTCAVYGRQILEALQFLHEKGIAHGAVHSGNVVIDNNVCKLLDIENQVLGLPHLYRRFMIKFKKLNSMEAIDIYCFGHLLYEMVFHDPLEKEACDDFVNCVDPLCRSVLESILTFDACKNGLPTAAGLLTHPFFNQVPLISYGKPSLRLPQNVKQVFQSTYENILKRLKEDQKKVKLKKLQDKADSYLLGECARMFKTPKKYKSPDLTVNVSSTSANKSIASEPVVSDDSALKSTLPEASLPTAETRLPTDEGTPATTVDTEKKTVEESCDLSEALTTTTTDNVNVPSSTPPSLRNNLLSSIASFDKTNLRKRELT